MPGEYTGVPLEISGRGNPQPNIRIVRTLPGHFNMHPDSAEQLFWQATGINVVYFRSLGEFRLTSETIEPNYGDITVESGFLNSTHNIDGSNKRLTIQLHANTEYQAIDDTYQHKSFHWNEAGFYKLKFDYQVVLASNFILELTDDEGTVIWSKTGSITTTAEEVNIISTSWQFRLRCRTSVTTNALFDNWIHIDNLEIIRYHSTGQITQNWWHEYPNMNIHEQLWIQHIKGVPGAALKARLMMSDDADQITYSQWIGQTGTADYYEGDGGHIYTGGYTGKYWRARVYFESDGRYSPVLKGMTYTMYLDRLARHSILERSQEHLVGVPVQFTPMTWLNLIPEGNDRFLYSGRTFTRRAAFLMRSQEHPALVPVQFTPMAWEYADFEGNNRLALSKRMFIFARFRMERSWAESAVGVVMSGYARDQNGDLIKDAYKIVIESSQVPDRDIMGQVDPETGVFQVFVQEAIYDRRYLLVEYKGKAANIALSGYGEPVVLDGTKGPVDNQDLHFWKAPICTTVAYVGSFVDY